MVVDLLSAGAGALLLAAAGARLRRVARVPLPPSLKLPIDFLAGSWLMGTGALTLGLLGAFRPLPLLLLAGILAAAGRWRRPGWRLREVPVAALPLLPLLPVALSSPFFYDALVYHLALPWQGLLQGRLAAHPEDLFSTFPPLAQMIYAVPLAAGLHRTPALLHLASFLAASLALAALASRIGAPRPLALLAGAALPLLPAVALVPGFPAAEGWTLAGLLASFAVAVSGRDRPSSFLLAGWLAGMALAARLQGGAWCGIVVLFVAMRPRRGSSGRRRPLFGRVASVLGMELLGCAPWWLKNGILLHDPLAPLNWRREGVESLWRDAGTLMHTAAGPGAAARNLALALVPHLSYLLPLALGAALGFLPRRTPSRALGAASLLGLAAWAATGTLPRFLAPTLALLLVLSAAAGRTRVGIWVGGVALGWTVVLGAAVTGRQLLQWGLFALKPSTFDARSQALVLNSPLPVFAEAVSLPAGARVLFIGEPRAFPFPRPFVCPSQHDVSPLLDLVESTRSAPEIRRALRGLGFTHLLINRAEMARLAAGYPIVPWRTEAGKRRFQELLNSLGAPVLKAGEVGIFELPETGGSGSRTIQESTPPVQDRDGPEGGGTAVRPGTRL